MTIDESILYMELYKRKLFDSISDLDKDIEAYDVAINIMRKYQKIAKIFNYITDVGYSNDYLYDKISEVIKDGKND